MSEPLEDRSERWPVRASEDVWRGGAPFAVRLDTVTAPSEPDKPFGRLVVEHPGAVVVLAVDEEERAMVLEQYRHPIGQRLVELPAGLLDEPGEEPLAAARRELREEAGLAAGSWSHLMTAYTSPGICAERVELYLARDLTEVGLPDGFEPAHEEADMTTAWVPVADLVEGVLAGRLTDGPLAHAVLTYTIGRSPRRRGDDASGGSPR